MVLLSQEQRAALQAARGRARHSSELGKMELRLTVFTKDGLVRSVYGAEFVAANAEQVIQDLRVAIKSEEVNSMGMNQEQEPAAAAGAANTPLELVPTVNRPTVHVRTPSGHLSVEVIFEDARFDQVLVLQGKYLLLVSRSDVFADRRECLIAMALGAQQKALAEMQKAEQYRSQAYEAESPKTRRPPLLSEF